MNLMLLACKTVLNPIHRSRARLGRAVCWIAAFAGISSGVANAQETPDGVGSDWRTRKLDPAMLRAAPPPSVTLIDNGLPSILLTGYWPPTNEMLRDWSQSPTQNPGVWVGENWRGMGYNVYAFFPEFPGGTGTNPRGVGDFEVDYQDTSQDWWHLLPILRPIGIITTSRANTANGWEMEGGNGFFANSAWSNDYLAPFDPTDAEPHDPPGSQRFSSQPMQAIVDAVSASGAAVTPFVSPFDNGNFLSNYIGYHGNWWKDLHNDAAMPDRCYTAGHIHVGSGTQIAAARQAMQVTLEVVLRAVDLRRADFTADGVYSVTDVSAFLACMNGPSAALSPACARADSDQDIDADLRDLAFLQRTLR